MSLKGFAWAMRAPLAYRGVTRKTKRDSQGLKVRKAKSNGKAVRLGSVNIWRRWQASYCVVNAPGVCNPFGTVLDLETTTSQKCEAVQRRARS